MGQEIEHPVPRYVEYYQSRRNEMVQFLPEKYSRVLEVGCGEGRFVEGLSPCEYWGIEPVVNIAKRAEERLNRVIMARFEDSTDMLPNNYFDLVICNDVIEHMEDHNQFLKTISKKMMENAYLVGSVPNVRHIRFLYELLIKKDWQYKDAGILDRTHLRFFTKKSLKRILNDYGFSIEALKGLNSNTITKTMLILPIVVASFGFCADIRFLRYGFRAKLLS